MFEIVAFIAVILALLLVLAARKPDSFSVVREAEIKAPREAIFPLINDFQQWGSWSPWEKLPRGEGTTHFKWLMHGSCNFLSKIFHVFINMDSMIGKDFAAGLSNLKRLAER
jgi:hypothetical protein